MAFLFSATHSHVLEQYSSTQLDVADVEYYVDDHTTMASKMKAGRSYQFSKKYGY